MEKRYMVSNLGEFPVPIKSPGGTRLVSQRHIGLEIELENITRDPRKYLNPPYWEITTDGSLRQIGNDTESLELRFAQPLGGADAEHALTLLDSFFKRDKDIFCSERTGLHVHIDFRDFTLAQYRRFLYLYLLLEPLLYSFCEKSRENNIFCIPWYKTPSLIRNTLNSGELISPDRNTANIKYALKYSGLNLRALGEKGSVEFRMLEATTNIDKIFQWVNILLGVVEYSYKSEFNIRKILADLEHTTALIRLILQSAVDKLPTKEFNERLEMGKESVYLSLASSRWNPVTVHSFVKNGESKRREEGLELEEPRRQEGQSAQEIMTDATLRTLIDRINMPPSSPTPPTILRDSRPPNSIIPQEGDV